MRRFFCISLVIGVSVFMPLAARAQQAATDTAIRLDAIVAVVGDQPITRFDLQQRVIQMIQERQVQAPTDAASQHAVEKQVLDQMVDEELILQKAKELKVEVSDADIAPDVDKQVKQVRSQFASEAEFRTAIAKAGLGTPEEYRRMLTDQLRRQLTLQKTMAKLRQDNKITPVNVTEAEVEAEFQRTRQFLPPRPAAVTFRQIVIAPRPSEAEKEVARVKAESLLSQLKHGSDFEQLAKRESMDENSRATGGDLGWQRRGDNTPEFERWLFGPYSLPPGQISPVVETPFGYHIIRVDRVQPGEVKARQILIEPRIDSADVARTAALADSVAALLKLGEPFDTLARKYNDWAGKEETSLLTPFPRDSLPPTYQEAFKDKKANDIVVFRIPGNTPEVPKFVVAQLVTVTEGGERTLADMHEIVRDNLAQAGAVRRYLDSLKKQTYVSLRLDDTGPVATTP